MVLLSWEGRRASWLQGARERELRLLFDEGGRRRETKGSERRRSSSSTQQRAELTVVVTAVDRSHTELEESGGERAAGTKQIPSRRRVFSSFFLRPLLAFLIAKCHYTSLWAGSKPSSAPRLPSPARSATSSSHRTLNRLHSLFSLVGAQAATNDGRCMYNKVRRHCSPAL